jgi:alpha-D-ribose 1-methylphosphonate 5-triphosphate synthase subunit PhnL
MPAATPVLVVRSVVKSFTLHTRGGAILPVLAGLTFEARKGECVALRGPSGAGKSTVLRLIYGNYKALGGEILIAEGGNPRRLVDIVGAGPRDILRLRADTIGYVSQFLRAIPRVGAVDIVAEPLMAAGVDADLARARASDLLARLNIPERLWPLPPATFSGGEQQRVNIARGLIRDFPILLLDEPTAALDRQNRAVVVSLITEARKRGAAVLGIFHDDEVRDAVATRIIDLAPLDAAA